MSTPAITYSCGWPAPAKINLFLHITGRRADGYHLLQTLFQFIEVGDELDFRVRDDGVIRRVSALAGVAEGDDLVVRAARALQQASGTTLGADIRVHKRLPMGAGLGGGSSDAATTLVALNRLWQLDFEPSGLARLGLALGADIPVFVHGQAAWAEGVGEILVPFAIDETPVLVITPDCEAGTMQVFKDPDLTRDTVPIKMHGFSLEQTRNDCEAVTRRLYPAVGEALAWLSARAPAPARMSGTGASVFALFTDMESARAVARAVPAHWQAFCTWRRNRSALLDFGGSPPADMC